MPTLPATLALRTAAAEDLAAVDALLSRSYPRLLRPDYPPSTIVLAVPLIARANPRLIRSGRYFLVEREGRLVGAGGWSHSAPGSGRARRAAHIRHVATDPRVTRQGIGRALMRHVLDNIAGAGLRVVECLSTRTAVPFYTACGFLEVEPVEVPLAPGIDFPAIRMARRV